MGLVLEPPPEIQKDKKRGEKEHLFSFIYRRSDVNVEPEYKDEDFFILMKGVSLGNDIVSLSKLLFGLRGLNNKLKGKILARAIRRGSLRVRW